MTFKYPLLENAFSKQDMNEAIKVIKSTRITMSKKTKEFEKYYKKFPHGATLCEIRNSNHQYN